MYRIGIALGGGGITGSAHLGVLAALEEAGISFDCLAGTSSGALVAALYGSGYTIEEIIPMVPEFTRKYMDYDYRAMFRKMLWRQQEHRSLIKGKKFRQFLLSKFRDRQIKDMIKPVAFISTDLKKARKVVFTSKPLVAYPGDQTNDFEEISDISIVDAVQASCSVPTVFPPVEWGDRVLVDGGLTDNCPSGFVRALGAERVIAVDLSTIDKPCAPLNSLFSIINRSVNIFLLQQAKSLHKHTDILLNPDVSQISSFAFEQTLKCVEIGYEYTRKRMDEILAVLEHTTHTASESSEALEPLALQFQVSL